MDEITLSNILHENVKDTDKYLGIYTKNNFFGLNIMKYEYCSLVLFIDNISINLGHWCVIVKIRNNLYFLDSFALHPQYYGIDFKYIKNSKKLCVYYLTQRTQDDETSTCGAYVIYYLMNIINCKYKITCFISRFRQTFFETNYRKNDQFIIYYLSTKFPKYVSEKNCVNFFCNSNFIINRKQCLETLCNVSSKVSEV